MALFRNLGVNLRDRLCDVLRYASAQSLDFLDLAKKCSFLNWKLTPVPISLLAVRGWALSKNGSEQAKMDLGNSSAHMGTILLVKHIKSVCSAVALRTR
jgi:hypothetical protein